MGARVLIVGITAVAAFAYGCEKVSTKYCKTHNDVPNCGFQDAPIDSPPPCTTNADCAGTSTPVCDVPHGECVECLGSADCTGSNKLCNLTSNTCVGCVAHTDCAASSVCQADGTCAGASTVIYVDGSAGSNTGTCTMAAPCKTITYALGSGSPAGRTIVKLSNAISDNVSIAGVAYTFYSDPGASVTSAMANPAFALGASSIVTIYDLDIVGATGKAVVTGMTATLRLHRSIVEGGTLGFDFKMSSLNVFRSTIAHNTLGGIQTDGTTTFDIENSFIVLNGTAGMAPGGALFGTNTGGNNVFQFNTVADNLGKVDGTHAAGVTCGVPTLAMPNNLLANNSNGTLGSNALIVGGCDATGSLQGSDDAPFAFKNAGGPGSSFDYHILPGSTAIDTAPDGSPSIATDFDGQHRPNGSGKDYGADEYTP